MLYIYSSFNFSATFNELNTNLTPIFRCINGSRKKFNKLLKVTQLSCAGAWILILTLWLQNLPLNHYALLPPGQGIESTLPNLVSILTTNGPGLNFLPLFRKAVKWCFRMERCILSIIHDGLYFLKVP